MICGIPDHSVHINKLLSLEVADIDHTKSQRWVGCWLRLCGHTAALTLSPCWHSLAEANEQPKLSLSLGDLPLVWKDFVITGEGFWRCVHWALSQPARPAVEFQLHNLSELYPLLAFWTCMSYWRKAERNVIAFQGGKKKKIYIYMYIHIYI